MQANLFVKQHFKDDDATTMAPDSPTHGLDSPQSSDDDVFWQRQTEKRRRADDHDKTAEKMLDYESRTIISSEKNNKNT